MTTPTPPQPDGLTFQDAVALVAAAQAAQTPGDVVAAVTLRVTDAAAAVRDRAVEYAKNAILRLWRDVQPYDGASVQAFTEAAGQVMVTAQNATATAAAAAQSQILSSMGVSVPPTVSIPDDVRGAHLLDDDGERPASVRVDYGDGTQIVDLDDARTVDMFNRPARTYRFLQSQGLADEQAMAQATERMMTLVDGNAMLAQRLAESDILAKAIEVDPRIIGVRRIIHPELSRTGTCGLCIAASTRLYTVRELKPIHDRCNCTQAAVTKEFDPADVLNKIDLDDFYSDAGGTSGAQLKRTKYQIDEHGELGPVLVPKKAYKPRDPAKRKKVTPFHRATTAAESKANKAERMLPGFEKSLANLRRQGLGDSSPKVKYHLEQIAKLNRDLAGV